jgi:hypothetical protein
MTRADALSECRRLAAEDPDRATHSWIPRELPDGRWTVAKLGVPPRAPMATAQEAKPRPPQADDPRPALWRDVGGPYGAG